jgi:hypothetical protein
VEPKTDSDGHGTESQHAKRRRLLALLLAIKAGYERLLSGWDKETHDFHSQGPSGGDVRSASEYLFDLGMKADARRLIRADGDFSYHLVGWGLKDLSGPKRVAAEKKFGKLPALPGDPVERAKAAEILEMSLIGHVVTIIEHIDGLIAWAKADAAPAAPSAAEAVSPFPWGRVFWLVVLLLVLVSGAFAAACYWGEGKNALQRIGACWWLLTSVFAIIVGVVAPFTLGKATWVRVKRWWKSARGEAQ